MYFIVTYSIVAATGFLLLTAKNATPSIIAPAIAKHQRIPAWEAIHPLIEGLIKLPSKLALDASPMSPLRFSGGVFLLNAV